MDTSGSDESENEIGDDTNLLQQNSSSSSTTTSDSHKDLTNILKLFAVKDFKGCMVVYFLIGTIIGSIEEMFPVFAETSRTYHGLALRTFEVGIVFFGAGIILVLFQCLFVQRVTTAIGPKRSLVGASVCLVFCLPLIPVDSLIEGKQNVVGYATVVMGSVVVLVNVLLSQINVMITNITHSTFTGDFFLMPFERLD